MYYVAILIDRQGGGAVRFKGLRRAEQSKRDRSYLKREALEQIMPLVDDRVN